MFYSLSGKLIAKKPQFAAVEVNGAGFKVFISSKTLKNLPALNSKVRLFCAFVVRQEQPEIYGFLTEQELEIFELLNSISGVGPKSALGILGNFKTDKLLAAVGQGRVDLLSESCGVGKKKAQRIVMELKDKIKKSKIIGDFSEIDVNREIASALKNLGYKEKDIESVLEKAVFKGKKLEEKVKEALKIISRK